MTSFYGTLTHHRRSPPSAGTCFYATGEKAGLLTSYVISFASEFKFHPFMKSARKSPDPSSRSERVKGLARKTSLHLLPYLIICHFSHTHYCSEQPFLGDSKSSEVKTSCFTDFIQQRTITTRGLVHTELS